jgi:hypothetical protein
MKRIFLTLAALLFTDVAFAADTPTKPLTKEEQAAVSAYDGLEDEWRDKAIADWKAGYKSARNGRAKKMFLKNDPVFYRAIFDSSQSLRSDSWGRLLSYDTDGTPHGVEVFQIVSKSKALCKRDDDLFFVEGIDTSNIVDGKRYLFDEAFYVAGNATYKTALGTSKTVYVLKPLPEKPAAKSK